MSLLAQSYMASDHHLIRRAASAAAAYRVPDTQMWAQNNIWSLVVQPGWAEAYLAASPVDDGADPAAWAPVAGADPKVITDEQILQAVGELVAAQRIGPAPNVAPAQPTPAQVREWGGLNHGV